MLNDIKDKIIKTYCNKCKIDINHKIMECVNTSGNSLVDRDISIEGKVNEYYVSFEESHQIIECLGCNSKSFRELQWCSEWQDMFDPGISEKLYPSITKNNRGIKEIIDTPYNIKETYEQTIQAYNEMLWVLSAAGLRSVVEGICKHNGITEVIKNYTSKEGKNKTKKSKDLYDKIEKLFENGVITNQQKMTLHELRYLGNTSLHELEIPSKDDISIGLDIIENILQTLYEIPTKSKILTKKRENKEKKNV